MSLIWIKALKKADYSLYHKITITRTSHHIAKYQ